MAILEPPVVADGAILSRAARIELVCFDVDGVMTDGSLFLGDDGQEYKAFHARDGQGLKMLAAAGVQLAIITGRTSNVVQRRMQDLGIEHLFQGYADKRPVFQQLVKGLQLPMAATAFMGDDVVDLPVMLASGLAVTVADAHPLVKRHAHWVTRLGGGRGAVRELCELMLYARGAYDDAMEPYLAPVPA